MSTSPDPVLPALGRCLVMGVLNVTPDSFSDGGDWPDTEGAVRHGLQLVQQGADLVDVGGESTRPGAARVDAATELDRVLPVVSELVAAGVAVSVDTMRSEVAERAIQAGAVLVNDVSGGRADPAMLPVVASAGTPIVLMHWRAHSERMQQLASYGDVLREVMAELGSSIDAAVAAGMRPERIVVDPGLGFAKEPEHNWVLLNGMPALRSLGHPVLVGASRKRFLGELLAEPAGKPRPANGRDAATAALSALAAAAGAWCVRVHDVAASADAVRVAERWNQAPPAPLPAPASDRLCLLGLETFGYHGVLEAERRTGQRFVVDLELELDTAPAAAGDDLARTVDYGVLAGEVRDDVAHQPVNLLETLAHRLADRCLRDPRVRRVRVSVHKPEAPLAVAFRDVAVTIERSRQ